MAEPPTLATAGRAAIAGDALARLQAEAEALGSLPADTAAELVGVAGRFLMVPADVDVVEQATTLAGKAGVAARAVKGGLRLLLEVLNGAIKHGCTSEDVAADLAALGAGDVAARLAAEEWEGRGQDLAHRTATSAVTTSRLVDMSWSFGVSVATDEVAPVGETFLQLRLVLATGGGGRDNVYMELTLPQFYELLAQLQRAKAIMDFLASGA
ncbi:hypothetical protein FNF31_05929 [Cafeteria roenbergensis]|uniref:COMM domain-containing protein n=1 Tax=Cafeteria roenbergensis TaxID=33653 RepID=A0A5A8DBS2_CAFRO|nr:hypothetical protein FNF31_05929 [Cafeteria roenbergensis]KAA0162708.1 hypothetical protein FNF28_04589 [Cafeteria roenbergensis]